MKQRLAYLLPLVALTALAMANGCGDDDDDGPTQGSAGRGGGGSGRSGTGGGGQSGTGGAGGAGQGGGGAGGAGQGGGGFGGVPNVTPADTCATAPKANMPANQLGEIVTAQTFAAAQSNYEFSCAGKAVIGGADYVFNVVTPAVGVLTVRTGAVDANLNVALVASTECGGDNVGGAGGGGPADTLACVDNAPKGTPGVDSEAIFFPTKAGQESYVFVKTSAEPDDTLKFSLNAYFNQALSQAATDSCSTPPTALTVPLQDTANPEKSDVLVTGSTATATSNFAVPTTGAGGAGGAGGTSPNCPANAPGLKANEGKDSVVAVTPAVNGTMVVFVTPAPGDTTYSPVVWARGGGCEGATVLACGVGQAGGGTTTAALQFAATQGQTYHVVIDSLDAAKAGAYLADFFLIPPTATVVAEPIAGRSGPRYVVKDAAGKTLRVWERSSQ